MAPLPPPGDAQLPTGLAILEAGALLRSLLILAAQSAGHRVIHSAGRAEPFFQAIAQTPPQVVLLGAMEPAPGAEALLPLELLHWLRTTCPGTTAVLLIPRLHGEVESQLRAAGAAGVLDPHHVEVPQLLRALHEALHPSGIVPRRDHALPAAASLTPREREVLRRVGEGAANAEIAAQLAITERTVRAHIGNLYRKLGVDSRARMALTARGLEPQQTTAELDRIPFLPS